MAYIQTLNATRDYGGYQFTPMRLNGYWMGLSEVSKKQADELLKFPQITKITKTVYEELKKKTPQEGSYRTLPTNPTASSLPPPQPSVESAARSDLKADDLIKVGDVS
jgi:hypothetical protein